MQDRDDTRPDVSDATWQDLEDQIGRNQTYILELKLASSNIRYVSMYWYFAATACLFAAMGLGVIFIAPMREIQMIVPDTWTGQTVITTLLALAASSSAACFVRFVTLRRLMGEALEVAEANRCMIENAQKLIGR